MKKSNKILLGVLLAALLLNTIIHLSLYANYKKGHYTAYKEKDTEAGMTTHSVNKKHLMVENFNNVVLFISDEPTIKYEEGNNKEVRFSEKGDTLAMATDKPLNRYAYNGNVHLYVDSNMQVHFKNVNAVGQSKGRGKGLFLTLDNTRFEIGNEQESQPFEVGHFFVVARNQSSLEMNNARVGVLDVMLEGSELTEKASTINGFNLRADDASHISMSAKNILKATNKTVE